MGCHWMDNAYQSSVEDHLQAAGVSVGGMGCEDITSFM